MDFDEQLELDHFVLTERKCRVCGKTKDLIDGLYLMVLVMILLLIVMVTYGKQMSMETDHICGIIINGFK